MKGIPQPKEVHVIADMENSNDPQSTMVPLNTATEKDELLWRGAASNLLGEKAYFEVS